MERREFLRGLALLPLVPVALRPQAQAQLPDSCFFDVGSYPTWSVVHANLVAKGFTGYTTTGTGTKVSAIWVYRASDMPGFWKQISPKPPPREDYDMYNLDTAILVTLSGSN